MKVVNSYMHSSNSNQERNVSGNLNQDDFLKILVAQMKHQDPLAPTNDNEFMSQMVQFSTLEQMVNLNNKASSLSYLLALGFDSMNAFSFIGKTVEVQGKDGETLMGKVDKVLQKDGEFLVEVDSGLYSLSQINSVSNGSNSEQKEDDPAVEGVK